MVSQGIILSTQKKKKLQVEVRTIFHHQVKKQIETTNASTHLLTKFSFCWSLKVVKDFVLFRSFEKLLLILSSLLVRENKRASWDFFLLGFWIRAIIGKKNSRDWEFKHNSNTTKSNTNIKLDFKTVLKKYFSGTLWHYLVSYIILM